MPSESNSSISAGLLRRQRQRRFPSVNHYVSAAAVDGGDDALTTDRVGERRGEVDVRTAVLEQRGPGDDLMRAGGEDVLRARDRANAAADAAREDTRDLPDEREIVARRHRAVEVDHLHFREPLEPPHPPEDVIVADREALALHELDDGAVFEIDGWDEHSWIHRRTGMPCARRCCFSARTLVSA